MERFAKRRFAALLLALLLAVSFILPAAAAAPPAGSVPFTEVSPPEDAAPPPYHLLAGEEPQAVSDEPLRVLIVLDKPSLLEKGYAADALIDDAGAQAYNAQLEQDQTDVIAAIEEATGERLEVVWRLTVIANLLSAWVRPAQMETIAAVPGVRSVQEEAFLYPLETAGPGEAEESEPSGGESEPSGEESEPSGEESEPSGEESEPSGEESEPSGEESEPSGEGSEPSGEEAFDENAGGDGPAATAESSAPAMIAETGGTGEPEALYAGVDPVYTGAGQRIAIIDTGTDEWHRSLNSGAWMHALDENAKDLVQPLGNYLSSLPLLDEAGVEAVVKTGLLAITQQHKELLEDDAWKKLAEHGEAETLSGRSLRKVAFGANYSDLYPSYDIAHHERNEHGSHVAGIAAANRYLPTEECWDTKTGTLKPEVEPAYDLRPNVTVKLEDDEDDEESEPETRDAVVQGQAPDAQLLVMQVFGEYGAPESNYMAAIQDALLLGADAVNLSLGSNEAGASFVLTREFQNVMDSLTAHGVIVTMAYGNYSYWSSLNHSDPPSPRPELLYADDVSFATGGKPATYDTSFAVASATVDSDDKVRMSDFSSWGVPSTLELKPEITAPGNKIASLNGAHESMYESSPGDALHGNYEELSGTSMAAPQIAGMAALVMEHLKKNYPKEYPPLTDAERRQIAQSLLMSTAVPMVDPDNRYYSVMQQGAGLADYKKAVTANAYITMGTDSVFRPRTAADGKVKAELGDSDTGVFEFSFTVHSLDPDIPHTYKLSTELFTQELTTLSYNNKTPALGTKTTLLSGMCSTPSAARISALMTFSR